MMSASSRPLRLPRRHPVRRSALAAIAMLAVPLALAAGNVAFGANHVSARTVSVAEAQYLGEVDGFEQRRLRAVGLLAVAESVLASADLTLHTSAGKVLAPAVKAARAAAAVRAAEAARAAAARAPALSWRAPTAAGQPRTGTALFNKYVWTSGWQAQIDVCNGAVDLTGRYGVRVIGEHWSCVGSRFPSSGLITLSGVLSGTYRVGGVAAVLNAKKQGTGSIPWGYDLLYQTCINGSNKTMSFTVLTRVG